MGTKVFPEATLKIYFTASIDVRAKRRYEEMIESGSNPNLLNIRKSLEERDEKDINREVSPLKAAKDAIIIDSSKLNIDTILDKILGLYKISRV
jgi:cytidylate kinase